MKNAITFYSQWLKRSKNVRRVGLIAFLLFLTSCGPSWHLKRAKFHLSKAEALGAKFYSDTVYKEILIPKTVHDTVIQNVPFDRWLAGDTIRLNTTKWKLKQVIDTVTKKVYVEVECPEKIVRVPVRVETKIKAGISGWQVTGLSLFVLVLGFLVGMLIQSRREKNET